MYTNNGRYDRIIFRTNCQFHFECTHLFFVVLLVFSFVTKKHRYDHVLRKLYHKFDKTIRSQLDGGYSNYGNRKILSAKNKKMNKLYVYVYVCKLRSEI